MKYFTFKKPKIVGLLVLLFFVQGCSLATDGKAIDETQDRLVGAWVVQRQDATDLDYEIDLEDFKNEDSEVLYVEVAKENDAMGVDYNITGNIYPTETSFKHFEEDMETEVKADIFLTSSSPKLVKLYQVYEKASGEQYAMDGTDWMMVNANGVVGDQGKMFISNSYTEKNEEKDIEKKVTITVEFERVKDLASAKMIHLDENYDVILEEEFDLSKFEKQDNHISYDVKPNTSMVVVEETFMNPSEKTPYVVKTLYSSTFHEEITHDFILPIGNALAKKGTVKFIFK